MKTPLMELIEWMNDYNSIKYPPPEEIIDKATELLEKEREVIIKAAQYGFTDALRPFNQQCTSFDDYYTKTFTNESK